MRAIRAWLGLGAVLCGLVPAGCAPPQGYDYTNYRASRPRSILVLPPLNESTDIRGTYGYLSTVTRPLAELGYYVFPVVLVDQFLKENGMPTPGEMVQAPLDKIREVMGADAVLYITLREYGTRYRVFSSVTAVVADGTLVDTRTGTVLWTGTVQEEEASGGSGDILADMIGALVTQMLGHSTDRAHALAAKANTQFGTEDHGLLHGPYSPRYGTD